MACIEEINHTRLDAEIGKSGGNDKHTTGRVSNQITTEDSISDVLYISPKGEIIHNRLNGKLQSEEIDEISEPEKESNSLDKDDNESISFQKQLMQEGVLDFVPDGQVNAADAKWCAPLLALLSSCIVFLYMALL